MVIIVVNYLMQHQTHDMEIQTLFVRWIWISLFIKFGMWWRSNQFNHNRPNQQHIKLPNGIIKLVDIRFEYTCIFTHCLHARYFFKSYHRIMFYVLFILLKFYSFDTVTCKTTMKPTEWLFGSCVYVCGCYKIFKYLF